MSWVVGSKLMGNDRKRAKGNRSLVAFILTFISGLTTVICCVVELLPSDPDFVLALLKGGTIHIPIIPVVIGAVIAVVVIIGFLLISRSARVVPPFSRARLFYLLLLILAISLLVVPLLSSILR